MWNLHPKLVVFIICLSAGCQTTKKIKFEPASQGAKNIEASLVPIGDGSASGEVLGKLPVEVTVAKMTGKTLRLSAQGFDDQYWITPESLGESNTVKILLKQRQEGNDQMPALVAKASIVLLKSYEALAEKDFALAMKLADQSVSIFNLGPGAAIVKSIATWQKGDSAGALVILKEAKAVYPDTPELDELLTTIEKS